MSGENPTLCIILAAMENRTNHLAKQTLRILPAVVLFVAACVFLLDEPIALAVGGMLRSSSRLDEFAAGIPDILLPFVLVLSAGMWTARFLRVRKGRRDARADFYRLGGTVLPLSFIAKAAFKFLFGRIETRAWLENPAADLLWFHPGDGYGGFPSGHMAVFAALAAACWIFHPEIETPCLLLLLLLGSALVATNHHFLGDVIAGGYLGIAVAAATAGYLERHAA